VHQVPAQGMARFTGCNTLYGKGQVVILLEFLLRKRVGSVSKGLRQLRS